jgi:hypothetical protein
MTTAAAGAQTMMPRHRPSSRGIRLRGSAFVIDDDDKTVEMWMWGVLIMERGGGHRQKLNNDSNINNGRKTSTTSQAI